MTDERDDILLRKFFEENKLKVEDDGFSRRVMRRLPGRGWLFTRLWAAVCTLAGVLLFVSKDGFTVLSECVGRMFGGIRLDFSMLGDPKILAVSLLLLIAWGGYAAATAEH